MEVNYCIHESTPPVHILSQTIQSIPLVHSLQILFLCSSHLCLGLASDLSLGFSHQNPVCTTHMCYMPRQSRSSGFITQIICGEYRSYSSLLCSLLHFCCPILLRPKLPSSAPYDQTPQSIFLLQFQRPSFIPIQNKRQNYSSVYLSLCIFWQETGRQKILHRMIRYIPRVQPALNFFMNEILIC
jgi:hypothetical protein